MAVHAAGYRATEYQVDVPSFGDRGYVLAVPGEEGAAPALRPAGTRPLGASWTTRYCGPRRSSRWTAARRRCGASTLMDPVVPENSRHEWRNH
ncbi:hypothetical protein [Streptomyces sp. NPDC049887]|uniref:hypothetical protein n=1 Tax=Streptomyces sp. NPDC049887 TaxID=3155654 RepID=UPI00342529BB